ncbi:glucosamine-6-phosphate deaminase [Cyclobacterium jeungdonense]|uniref:Glucosamine-6-phosphate deaminase n=1 Tax=Cyclobacterium jeungdonense TaxID=708087 RepID=A0ABT8CAD2_9BACT|nr:glucosamine-6-phosphate deaminase [Cyclobacterium jeungdonense]MDN3689755.1 glucosamine-6-phosphate deaminase [Cyclobacterium jeungdonense]
MQIQIFQSREALHRAVADRFIAAVKANPQSVLGLSTGSSPLETYANLVRDHQRNGTDYSKIHTFNLDEYVGLSGSHPQSYRYFMNAHLFRHLNIPIAQTHVPTGVGDLEKECERYEKEILEQGGIDLQLLGLGTNGHIGFNEPGTSFDSRTHVISLLKETIEANARFFSGKEEVPTKAITMGIQSIMDARQIVLLAYGSKKAAPIRDAVNGPITETMPASILQNHPDVTLYLDEEAASLL